MAALQVPDEWVAEAVREKRRRERARDAASGVKVGLFRLPPRSPKPVPPEGFLEEGDVLAEASVAPAQRAQEELREIVRARRFGRKPQLGGSDHGG